MNTRMVLYSAELLACFFDDDGMLQVDSAVPVDFIEAYGEAKHCWTRYYQEWIFCSWVGIVYELLLYIYFRHDSCAGEIH